MGGEIVSAVIFGIVASIMLTIGISQYTAKKPVTFYSGEKALPPEKLTSVEGWNRAHGRLWIAYGAVILLGTAAFLLIGRKWAVVLPIAAVMLPIPLLVVGHNRAEKKYLIRSSVN